MLSEILQAVIVLPAATVQSATGFGYALLAAPLLVIVVGPALALPVLWLTFLPATVVMAAHLKTEIRWVIAWRMSLAGLLGATTGTNGPAPCPRIDTARTQPGQVRATLARAGPRASGRSW